MFNKKIIGFWAGDKNNFQFLDPLIESLESHYEIRRFDYNNNDIKLKEDLSKVDVAWFEWGNGPIIAASNINKKPPIICRVHRYELYSHSLDLINWDNVDSLIFSSPSMIKKFEVKYPEIDKLVSKKYLPIGVDLKKFEFSNIGGGGKKILYIGRIHEHKNPSLMIQIISKVIKIDPGYKLTVIGAFQDELYEEFFWDQVKKNNLSKNISYLSYTSQENLSEIMKSHDMFLITSIIEGLSQASLEAMACGLRPIIFNYFGAKYHYDKENIFKTVDEAVKMINKGNDSRKRYRRIIKKEHNLISTKKEIKLMIRRLTKS